MYRIRDRYHVHRQAEIKAGKRFHWQTVRDCHM